MKKKLFLISLIAIVSNAFGIVTTNDTMYPSKELGDIINDTPMYDAETIDDIAIGKADLTNVIFKSDLQAALESNKTDKAETVFGSIDRANNTWNALNELVGNEDQQFIPVNNLTGNEDQQVITEEHSFTRAIYSDNTTNDYEIVGTLSSSAITKNNLVVVEIGNTVTSIGSHAFYGCTRLTNLTIPGSVTNIGTAAFAGCTRLTSVTIPDSVTNIGDWAFRECTSLTNATIGNSVSSIGDRAFYGCTRLASVTIPDSVTSIWDRAFYDCNNLQIIYYTRSQDQTSEQALQRLKTLLENSELDLDSIEFIDITVDPLEPEKLGDFDPNKTIYSSEQVDIINNSINIEIEQINSQFDNYLPLTGGTITGSLAQGALVEASGQYSHAEGMMATAAGNYSHAEGWYTKANGDISHAAGISAKANDRLSYVWSGEQFTDIDEYCFDVANETIINPFSEFDDKVPIPMTINGMLGIESELWTDWIVQIDLYDSDFEEGNYIEIEYDADNTRWICRIDEEIHDVTDSPCTAEFFDHDFKFVYVGENEPNEFEICKEYGKEFYESNGEGTYNVNPVDGIYGFYIGNQSIGQIFVPTSRRINNKPLSSNITLTAEDVGAIDSAGTKTIFDHYKEINTIDSIYDTIDNVVDCYNALPPTPGYIYKYKQTENGIIITNISPSPRGNYVMPTTINGKIVTDINSSMFYNNQTLTSIVFPRGLRHIPEWICSSCKNLTNIDIPNSVVNIKSGAFQNCYALTNINFPKNLEKIEGMAFYSTGITNVILPDSMKIIENNAFQACTSLVSIAIGGTESIGSSAFYNCFALSSVECGNALTNFVGWCFSTCPSLTNVVIKDGLKKIGSGTFYGTYNLKSIYIPNSVETIGERAFNDCNALKTIYYKRLDGESSEDAIARIKQLLTDNGSALPTINIANYIDITDIESDYEPNFPEKLRNIDLDSRVYTADQVDNAIDRKAYELPAATDDTLGGIIVGNNLNVTEDGVLSVPNADANSGTRGATYLSTDFGLTSDTRVGYAVTEYAFQKFNTNSIFPYLMYTTTSNYNIGDRVRYKFSAYECLENNVTGNFDGSKWQKIDPLQTQIDNISNAGYITLNDLPVASTTNAGIVQLYNGATGSRDNQALAAVALNNFARYGIWNAAAYSSTKIYNTGDRVRHQNTAFECLQDGVSNIAPTVTTTWKNLCIQDQIDNIDSNVSSVSNSLDTTISNVSSISNTVNTISDKVDSFESEEWTFTLDNGSQIEKHIGVSSNSWPETCYLFWNTNYVAENISSSSTIYIPTNFPTKRLYLVVDDTDQARCFVAVKNHMTDFDRNIIIDITPVRTSDTNTLTTRDFRVNVAGSQVSQATGNTQYRTFHLEYDNFTKSWFTDCKALVSRPYFYSNGVKTYCPSDNVPSTVEEWIALQNQQTESTPTQPLFGGTFTPPVSPTPDESSDEDDSQIDEEEPDEEPEVITEGE